MSILDMLDIQKKLVTNCGLSKTISHLMDQGLISTFHIVIDFIFLKPKTFLSLFEKN
jgi:hypothetical protein